MTEMTVKKYLEPYYTLDRVTLGSILETARKETERPLSLQDVANRIGGHPFRLRCQRGSLDGQHTARHTGHQCGQIPHRHGNEPGQHNVHQIK